MVMAPNTFLIHKLGQGCSEKEVEIKNQRKSVLGQCGILGRTVDWSRKM